MSGRAGRNQGAAAPAGGPGWLLGLPDCGRPDCAAAFGAVVFTVEAVK